MSGKRNEARSPQQAFEAEWEQEISRRIAEVDSGQAKMIAWSDARRRILEILDKGGRKRSSLTKNSSTDS